ncbi:MAG: hypothetical protein H7646_02795 [Candidatus Heimdallarchaeota archaeon]|nr:hypothetical protein [Candidatus Heimdallarchaeota archaeon]
MTNEKLTDDFQLIINAPVISQNTTYLTVMNLNITFTNDTAITDASAEDNVTLVIFNDKGFSSNYTMDYDLNRFNGWGKEIFIFYYEYPGIYYIDLIASTGLYYYNNTLDSFEIGFSTSFRIPLLGLSNESRIMHISISITIKPYIYLDYVLFNSTIYGCIFNSFDYNVKTVILTWGGFSFWWYRWTSDLSVDDLETGYYYAVGFVVYEEELFISPPSNRVLYMPDQPTETPTTSGDKTALIIISLSLISFVHLLRKKKYRQ